MEEEEEALQRQATRQLQHAATRKLFDDFSGRLSAGERQDKTHFFRRLSYSEQPRVSSVSISSSIVSSGAEERGVWREEAAAGGEKEEPAKSVLALDAPAGQRRWPHPPPSSAKLGRSFATSFPFSSSSSSSLLLPASPREREVRFASAQLPRAASPPLSRSLSLPFASSSSSFFSSPSSSSFPAAAVGSGEREKSAAPPTTTATTREAAAATDVPEAAAFHSREVAAAWRRSSSASPFSRRKEDAAAAAVARRRQAAREGRAPGGPRPGISTLAATPQAAATPLSVAQAGDLAQAAAAGAPVAAGAAAARLLRREEDSTQRFLSQAGQRRQGEVAAAAVTSLQEQQRQQQLRQPLRQQQQQPRHLLPRAGPQTLQQAALGAGVGRPATSAAPRGALLHSSSVAVAGGTSIPRAAAAAPAGKIDPRQGQAVLSGAGDSAAGWDIRSSRALASSLEAAATAQQQSLLQLQQQLQMQQRLSAMQQKQQQLLLEQQLRIARQRPWLQPCKATRDSVRLASVALLPPRENGGSKDAAAAAAAYPWLSGVDLAAAGGASVAGAKIPAAGEGSCCVRSGSYPTTVFSRCCLVRKGRRTGRSSSICSSSSRASRSRPSRQLGVYVKPTFPVSAEAAAAAQPVVYIQQAGEGSRSCCSSSNSKQHGVERARGRAAAAGGSSSWLCCPTSGPAAAAAAGSWRRSSTPRRPETLRLTLLPQTAEQLQLQQQLAAEQLQQQIAADQLQLQQQLAAQTAAAAGDQQKQQEQQQRKQSNDEARSSSERRAASRLAELQRQLDKYMQENQALRQANNALMISADRMRGLRSRCFFDQLSRARVNHDAAAAAGEGCTAAGGGSSSAAAAEKGWARGGGAAAESGKQPRVVYLKAAAAAEAARAKYERENAALRQQVVNLTAALLQSNENRDEQGLMQTLVRQVVAAEREILELQQAIRCGEGRVATVATAAAKRAAAAAETAAAAGDERGGGIAAAAAEAEAAAVASDMAMQQAALDSLFSQNARLALAARECMWNGILSVKDLIDQLFNRVSRLLDADCSVEEKKVYLEDLHVLVVGQLEQVLEAYEDLEATCMQFSQLRPILFDSSRNPPFCPCRPRRLVLEEDLQHVAQQLRLANEKLRQLRCRVIKLEMENLSFYVNFPTTAAAPTEARVRGEDDSPAVQLPATEGEEENSAAASAGAAVFRAAAAEARAAAAEARAAAADTRAAAPAQRSQRVLRLLRQRQQRSSSSSSRVSSRAAAEEDEEDEEGGEAGEEEKEGEQQGNRKKDSCALRRRRKKLLPQRDGVSTEEFHATVKKLQEEIERLQDERELLRFREAQACNTISCHERLAAEIDVEENLVHKLRHMLMQRNGGNGSSGNVTARAQRRDKLLQDELQKTCDLLRQTSRSVRGGHVPSMEPVITRLQTLSADDADFLPDEEADLLRMINKQTRQLRLIHEEVRRMQVDTS